MITLKDISNFFKTFDLFGETFTFKSRKRKTYNSLIGGLTSFAFIVYTAYYLIFNLSDLLRKNSRTTDVQEYYLSSNSVNLKEHKDFIFFFCLRNEKMQPDFFLYNNLKFQGDYIDQKNKDLNYSFNKTALEFNSCSNKKFTKILPENFNGKDFESCQCLNATNLYSKNAYELRTDKTWADKAFLNLKVLPKDIVRNSSNDDENVDVKFLHKYFENNKSRMFLHFPSYYVDTDSISEPLKKNMITESFELNTLTSIYSKMEFSPIDFNEYTSIYNDGKNFCFFLIIFFLLRIFFKFKFNFFNSRFNKNQ